MKTKNILLFIFLFFLFESANAQGFFAGFGAGYGLPICGSVIGVNSNNRNSAKTVSTKNVKSTYGKGANFSGYFGYSISTNFAFQLGVNYLLGSNFIFTNDHVEDNASSFIVNNVNVKSWRLNPCVRLGYGHGKFRPYTRGGIVIGIKTKMTSEVSEIASSSGETNTLLQTFEYSGGSYVGFSGGLGVTFTLINKISMYVELSNYYVSWSPTKGALTKSTYNGNDQLGVMSTSEKQFEYVNEVDETMNTSSSESTKQLKRYSPMSSIGVNAGLHFSFGE